LRVSRGPLSQKKISRRKEIKIKSEIIRGHKWQTSEITENRTVYQHWPDRRVASAGSAAAVSCQCHLLVQFMFTSYSPALFSLALLF